MRPKFIHSLVGAFAVLLLSGTALAVNDAPKAITEFDTPEQEALYQGLVRELRCTVCQNQTLLDSNSGLAQDLRHNVYQQVRSGASRETVVDFMVSRYGDFVLYRPPFRPATLLLWLGPLLFLIVGAAILAHAVRQQRNRSEEPLPTAEADATADTPVHHKHHRGK